MFVFVGMVSVDVYLFIVRFAGLWLGKVRSDGGFFGGGGEVSRRD